MTILPSKDLTGEDLRDRYFVCYLPTEIVIPCRYTGNMDYCLRQAFAYRLPYKRFPVKRIEGKDANGHGYKWNYQQIAMECYENYGSDGHIDYTLQPYFMIFYEDEIKHQNIDFKTYSELTNTAYNLYREIRDSKGSQLTFNSLNWVYNHIYG
jgi:hypothetical protein